MVEDLQRPRSWKDATRYWAIAASLVRTTVSDRRPASDPAGANGDRQLGNIPFRVHQQPPNGLIALTK